MADILMVSSSTAGLFPTGLAKQVGRPHAYSTTVVRIGQGPLNRLPGAGGRQGLALGDPRDMEALEVSCPAGQSRLYDFPSEYAGRADGPAQNGGAGANQSL